MEMLIQKGGGEKEGVGEGRERMGRVQDWHSQAPAYLALSAFLIHISYRESYWRGRTQ